MKPSRWTLLLLLLLAPLVQAADQPGRGIPYRILWHAYCLGQLSSNPAERLKLTSDRGVDPTTFRFTPVDADGNPPLQCDATGLCVVRWLPVFDADNRKIFSNQPPGSMDISFGWSFNYNSSLPVGIDLLLNGRRYAESAYHWVALKNAFAQFAAEK